MKIKYILSVIAASSALLMGNIITDADDFSKGEQQQQPSKSVKLNYVSNTGKKLVNSRTINVSGDMNAYGDLINKNGYFDKIKGYIPYKLGKDYTYDNIPKQVTLKYVKLSTVTKKVENLYFKQINTYRKQKHLRPFKHSKSLQKKANVRSKELWKKTSHIRPNGKSYNKRGSGYAEVMGFTPEFFLQSNSIIKSYGPMVYYNNSGYISYKNTAQSTSHYLLTVDQQHRLTELNTWARYSAVSFNFKDDFSGNMAQLFH